MCYSSDLSTADIMEAVNEELKMEQQPQHSPTGNSRFSFSRSGSTGSVHAISCSSASSAPNTGDNTLLPITHSQQRGTIPSANNTPCTS